MEIEVTSPAFEQGMLIPRKYTCDGENFSPPLMWQSVPENAISLALICDDPDAPSGTFAHWILFDLPTDTKELPEHISPAETALPDGATQGTNSANRIGYMGPCPPSGTHRYFFKIYALDTKIGLGTGATKGQVESAIKGHILAEGELMGTYSRY